ncbi:uncharacterized protein [Macrobrachium rosenbergii]|uniref:uncharacterized protein isoform X2 n=1 Tax=Macrobrachium rosenbergii TaxID=79674 RepID=UPI0034D54420
MKTLVPVLVAVLAVVHAVAAATEDFVVPGSCPLVDEASLWARHRPNLWQMDGFWYHHSHTPTPYNPIVNCTQMRLEYIGGSFRTEATGIDEDNAFMKTTGMIYEAAGGAPPSQSPTRNRDQLLWSSSIRTTRISLVFIPAKTSEGNITVTLDSFTPEPPKWTPHTSKSARIPSRKLV